MQRHRSSQTGTSTTPHSQRNLRLECAKRPPRRRPFSHQMRTRILLHRQSRHPRINRRKIRTITISTTRQTTTSKIIKTTIPTPTTRKLPSASKTSTLTSRMPNTRSSSTKITPTKTIHSKHAKPILVVLLKCGQQKLFKLIRILTKIASGKRKMSPSSHLFKPRLSQPLKLP